MNGTIKESLNKAELVLPNDQNVSSRLIKRKKKFEINYLESTPFTISRQLEDQRTLAELNSNPQLFALTKADKLRSNIISQRKKLCRDRVIKANVVNKIVREATSIHNYTIVPPPITLEEKLKKKEEEEEIEREYKKLSSSLLFSSSSLPSSTTSLPLSSSAPINSTLSRSPSELFFDDKKLKKQIINKIKAKQEKQSKLTIETNPSIKPYLYESQATLKGVDFGHRPSSASRVFHPSTMKFKLKKGEVLPSLEKSSKKNDGKKRTVGLPCSVLTQVLRAGEIKHDLELFDKENENVEEITDDDFYDTENIGKKKKKKKNKPKEDLRPSWDDNFPNNSKLTNTQKFSEKQSLINGKEDLSLSERVQKFILKSSGKEDFSTSFCEERLRLDKLERLGEKITVPRSTPVEGQKLYFDPWDTHVQIIQDLNRKREEKKERKMKMNDFKIKIQEQIDNLAVVSYFPTSKLLSFEENTLKSTINNDRNNEEVINENSSFGTSNLLNNEQSYEETDQNNISALTTNSPDSSPNKKEKSLEKSLHHLKLLDENYPDWRSHEKEIKSTLKQAKKGDTHILYEHFILPYKEREYSSSLSPSSSPSHTNRVPGKSRERSRTRGISREVSSSNELTSHSFADFFNQEEEEREGDTKFGREETE